MRLAPALVVLALSALACAGQESPAPATTTRSPTTTPTAPPTVANEEPAASPPAPTGAPLPPSVGTIASTTGPAPTTATAPVAPAATVAQAPTTARPPVAPPGYPRTCQAWNGIQNLPDLSEAERRARHDLMWSGTWDLGLRWDNSEDRPYRGLAATLSDVGDDVAGNDGYETARAMKEDLLRLNPNMKTLVEIRYRDGRFVATEDGLPWWDLGHYPPDSPFWITDSDGQPVPGWGEDADGDGALEADEVLGSLIDFRRSEVIELVAQKALALERTGVVDGVFLDWWNEHDRTAASYLDWSTFYMSADEEVEARLEILRRIRELVGDDFLVLVNTNERTAPLSAPYVNGTFMEVWKPDWSKGYSVERLRTVEDTLYWASENLREPRINCLEGWRVVYDYGNEASQVDERNSAENRRWMRLFTTLALTHSDGHVLFGDDNAEPTWDHHHNWYDFWDADLGQPVGPKRQALDDVDGLFYREFTNGWAVYNRSGGSRTIVLPGDARATSTGTSGPRHVLGDMDGEIYLGAVSSGGEPHVGEVVAATTIPATTPPTPPPATTSQPPPPTTAAPPEELAIDCAFDPEALMVSCTATGFGSGSRRWTSSLASGWGGGDTYERALEWGENATEATVQLEVCNGDDCTVATASVDLTREPSGDCPSNFDGWFTTFPLPDMESIQTVGPPGREIEGWDYKGHGYFRVPNGQNVVDVRMPIDATLVNAAVYIEADEPQYSLTFRTACEGLEFLFDHIGTPVQAIADRIDWEPTGSSAGYPVEHLLMLEGDVIGTSIGTVGDGNAFVDFGVNDSFARLPTPESPLAYGRHLTAVCFYDFFSPAVAANLRSRIKQNQPVEAGFCP